MAAELNTEPKTSLLSRLPNLGKRIVYFLPLILPVVVVLTYFLFYQKFLFCTSDHPCSPFTSADILAGVSTSDQTRVAAYVARASWTLVNGMHFLACLCAIVTAGIVIYKALSEYDPKLRWTIVLLTVAAALDVAFGVSLLTLKDVLSPAQQLHRATIGQVLPSISKYNRIAEALSLTGALTLAVAACAILWRRDIDRELDDETVKKRMKLLRAVLYVGAATLVIAVLRLAATHAWAVSYLPPESDLGKAVATLTTGIIGSLGTSYTLVIAGIYLPAALILRSQLKEDANAKSSIDGWLALTPRILALIAPLLAGPVGKLLVDATNSFGGGS